MLSEHVNLTFITTETVTVVNKEYDINNCCIAHKGS